MRATRSFIIVIVYRSYGRDNNITIIIVPIYNYINNITIRGVHTIILLLCVHSEARRIREPVAAPPLPETPFPNSERSLRRPKTLRSTAGATVAVAVDYL